MFMSAEDSLIRRIERDLTSHLGEEVDFDTIAQRYDLSPATFRRRWAEIIRRGGSYRLHLDLSRVPNEPASYVEVWLIDRQVKGMISLGPFHGDGDYTIPSGVDPAKYPIVDVSIEPADGVPTHSGVSIVRGLATT